MGSCYSCTTEVRKAVLNWEKRYRTYAPKIWICPVPYVCHTSGSGFTLSHFVSFSTHVAEGLIEWALLHCTSGSTHEGYPK